MKTINFTILLCLITNLAFSASLLEKIHFASTDTAKVLLKTEDEYTKRWGRFDIECRMQKIGATKEELLAFISEQVQEWTPREKELILRDVAKVDSMARAEKLNLPFPDDIYLINIKGTENSKGEGFAYTRRNFIALNANEELVIHELFHILSRNAPELRAQLYASIGFKLMPELILPQEMKDMQVLNPDAPIIDNYITVKKDGISIDCAAWTYTNEPYHGGKRYSYKQEGLILLNDKKEIAYENGKAVIYKLDEVTEYWEQIGKNTLYTDQPDEILAVNFVHLILGRTKLKSPWVVEKMKEILKK
jgi:hypothetical protein